MDKLHVVLAAAAVVLAVAAGIELQRVSAWESRATRAGRQAQRDGVMVRSLQELADSALARANHADTVRLYRTRLVPVIDTASHPDSTCAPALAARDSVIAAASGEVADLHKVVAGQIAALSLLTRDRDTLLAVVRARPKVPGWSFELFRPTAHLSLQVMVYPQARVGVGVSLDVLRFPL